MHSVNRYLSITLLPPEKRWFIQSVANIITRSCLSFRHVTFIFPIKFDNKIGFLQKAGTNESHLQRAQNEGSSFSLDVIGSLTLPQDVRRVAEGESF